MKWMKENEIPPVANTYYCRWEQHPSTKFVALFNHGKFQVTNQFGPVEWLDETDTPKEGFNREGVAMFLEWADNATRGRGSKGEWNTYSGEHLTTTELLDKYLTDKIPPGQGQ